MFEIESSKYVVSTFGSTYQKEVGGGVKLKIIRLFWLKTSNHFFLTKPQKVVKCWFKTPEPVDQTASKYKG